MKKKGIRLLLGSVIVCLLIGFIGCKVDPVMYSITFETNEGSSVDPKLIKENTKVSKPATPTRSGYVFHRWYADEQLIEEWDFTTPITQDRTLYAKWLAIYMITFDSQSASVNAEPTSKVITAPETTIDELPAEPVRAGYTFEGWFTEKDGKGNTFTEETNITKDITLYAHWRALEHTLSFDANGGSGTIDPIEGVETDGTIDSFTNTFNEPTSHTSSGYTFVGWATTSTGKGEYVADLNNFIMGPNDMTLYAKWGITKEELCEKAKIGEDVTQVDTSLITDMSYLFGINYSFNQDISGWDVSNVTDMSGLFLWKSQFNSDISGWDVSNVTDMSYMFSKAEMFNQDISAWDVSNVTNMNSMFSEAHVFNQDISAWSVSSVTDMSSMFYDASAFNQDISKWNVSSVTDMSNMFNDAYKFNQDISKWNVSSVTDMNSMFYDASAFNQDISKWNVSSVEDMEDMFNDANTFNQDLTNWDVSSVENMESMFEDAIAFNGDISTWNVSSVMNMDEMFYGASSFNQNLTNWDVSSVENMDLMFYGASLFNQNLSEWDVSSVISYADFDTDSGLISNHLPNFIVE